MKDFWQFPTVSMGSGPINSIYQARFMRYLEHRGLIPATPRKVWAFLGDGEMDEPESTGAIGVAVAGEARQPDFRDQLQPAAAGRPGARKRQDHFRELEALFRGSGWNVIKCLWGSDWDALLAKDRSGRLVQLMNECVDGEYQSFKAKGGAYVRKEFFGRYPETAALVEDMTDEQIANLRRGGHDPLKVYNAYKRAVEHTGGPTVVLAKTVKGYGMGEAGEARNPTHQNKKLNEKAIEYFRTRFEIPIPDEAARDGALYRPPESSPEIAYMQERRRVLGGYLPNPQACRIADQSARRGGDRRVQRADRKSRILRRRWPL